MNSTWMTTWATNHGMEPILWDLEAAHAFLVIAQLTYSSTVEIRLKKHVIHMIQEAERSKVNLQVEAAPCWVFQSTRIEITRIWSARAVKFRYQSRLRRWYVKLNGHTAWTKQSSVRLFTIADILLNECNFDVPFLFMVVENSKNEL